MQKQKSLKLNFIMNAILTMSAFVFPLITFPYVSRILLPAGTGRVSFATAVISYFALFAQLGIPTYGIRVCAQVRDNREKLTKVVQEIFIINIVMSIFTYIFFATALFTVPRLQQDRALFAIASLVIFLNVIGFEWLYKALEQYTYITIRSIIFKFIALLAMFALVHKQNDYVIYGAISIFAASASNILNFINIHKYVDIKPVGNYNIKRHLKPIIVFFAMACATTIYTQLDIVMLGFMTTDVDVGYYNAAVKIKSILISIVTSLGVVLLPRASYYVEHGLKDEFLRITQKAINFVILVATPMMLYFTIFSREGITFLSGDAYAGSIIPMQIIMPTLLFIGLTNIMGMQMLVPLGKEKIVLYSEIAGAVVNLVLNTLLIPRMASSGAAIGTLVAEIVVWLVQYSALHGTVLKAYRKVHYGFILLALALASVASIWVKMLSFSALKPSFATLIVLIISAVLFFGMYVLVLTIKKEPLVVEIERQMIGKVVSKIRKHNGIS
ncbi:MAG: flippase [Ruminococcus sp.]|nr:flippase [Ruminococcus sp.]